METALGWLGDIFRAIIRLIPQLIIVRATHAGVKFRHGSDIIQLLHSNGLWRLCVRKAFPWIGLRSTGIHIIWPLVTEYEVVPIKRQTINLAVQYLCTSDNKKIGVGGIVVYEVVDVEKLLTECHDYDDTIQDLSLSGIKSVITSHKFQYLLDESDKVDTELTRSLSEELKRFGIKVIKVTLSDFAECRMLALWGTAGGSPI